MSRNPYISVATERAGGKGLLRVLRVLRRRLQVTTPRRAFIPRVVRFVALVLFLGPLRLWAQSGGPPQPSSALMSGPQFQVKQVDRAVRPIRFESGTVRENCVEPLDLAVVRSSNACTEVTTFEPDTIAAGWRRRAAAIEPHRLEFSPALADSALLVVQDPGPRRRGWIRRHPVLFGALVGFGGGFLIGYLAGDDGVFYDFTAEFNGVLLGGIGAGAGAVVGGVIGR